MAHLVRSDIPFHYALADAFTICDAYHCSVLGPTDPNRYYMWTRWVGNDGKGGGPVIDNAEVGYDWSTFPELLQNAGISWKIYQDMGLGLTAAESWGFTSDAYIGNYGGNALLYFHQYQNAQPGSPLSNGAKTGSDIQGGAGGLFDIFRHDVASGKLPQVSWCENDGFFDHLVPPTVPQPRAQGLSSVDISNEMFGGDSQYPAGPYGLGVRVPMIVISPWSKGGWVNSEVFDHTSLIRAIERRFAAQYPGIRENNITNWRRAVTGDLTSAFNFASPNNKGVMLPSTIAYIPPDNLRHPDYKPVPPTEQAVPVQEPGVGLRARYRIDCKFAEKPIFQMAPWRSTLEISAQPPQFIRFTPATVRTVPGPTPLDLTPNFPILSWSRQLVKPNMIFQSSARTAFCGTTGASSHE
jgi:phospholipase C